MVKNKKKIKCISFNFYEVDNREIIVFREDDVINEVLVCKSAPIHIIKKLAKQIEDNPDKKKIVFEYFLKNKKRGK